MHSQTEYKHDERGRYLEVYLSGTCFYTNDLLVHFNKLMGFAMEQSPNKKEVAIVMKDCFAYAQSKIEPLISIEAPVSIDVRSGTPLFIFRLVA